jgi:hypothetical protein
MRVSIVVRIAVRHRRHATAYGRGVLAIDYEGAKNLALGVAAGFVVLSIASAIIIKNIVTKLVSVLLMVGLALGAWTQRSNLQDCYQRAQERYDASVRPGLTCNFFGSDVTIVEDDDPTS